MNKDKLIEWGLRIAVIMIVFFLAMSAMADDRQHQSNDMNTVGGDIGGDDTVAIGFSSPSFGAAIAQCAGTTAKSFFFGAYGQQRIEANYWCIGSSLYQMGKYHAAALALCKKTEMGDLYPSEGECLKDLSAAPETPVAAPVVVSEETGEDMHAAEIEAQQMLIVDRLAKLENLQAYEPQVVERTIVQEVERFTEDQRARLAEVKE